MLINFDKFQIPPLVSIIIPLHNRESIIHSTLKSVLQQTYENWECIIVDDHSTDSSYDVAKEWEKKDARFMVYRLPDPKRYGNAARNFGVTKAKGEYLNFLDSDDLLDKHKIELQLREFQENPELDMVTCQHIFFESLDKLFLQQMEFAKPEFWEFACWNTGQGGLLWSTSSCLWKKNYICSIGLWNEKIRAWQDVELNIRALANDGKINRLDKTLVYCAVNAPESISATMNRIRNKRTVEAMVESWIFLNNENKNNRIIEKLFVNKLLNMSLQQGNIFRKLEFFILNYKKIKLFPRYLSFGLISIFISSLSNYRSKKFMNKFMKINKIFEFSKKKSEVVDIHKKQQTLNDLFTNN